jgi:hypothetical protein
MLNFPGTILMTQCALECYRSPEYAKVMALRQGKSVMDLAIVVGYDGPPPPVRQLKLFADHHPRR